MKTKFSLFSRSLLTSVLFITLGCLDLLAQSGIYVGGHFRRERNHTITDLKASGFTYVILFGITVEPNGDLTTDGQTICSNGNYVFGATNPNYVADVTSLKIGATSINRVESCVGGWGNHSYSNIRNLVNSQGAGPGSILYRNFRALKNAIPAIDAINNDDEEAYDVNSATAFHVMLADVGFKSTLAPYMNRGYWQNLATNVNNQRGGAVDKIYLQWYEGGAGNNPCDWNINNIEMHTGDLNYENSGTVNNKMTSARDNCRSKGGFLWVYNDNNINLRELAQRINTIYGVKPNNPNVNGLAAFYKDCNYGGTGVGLGAGDYTLAQLQARGLLNDDLSSLKVSAGYEVQLFQDDNFQGGSVTVGSNNGCFDGNWNDKVSSLKVRALGSTVATAYRDCNYTGTGAGLSVGDYTLTQLQARGLLNDDLSSLKVSAGYEVQLFQDDNFQGGSVTIGSNGCFDGTWNDKVSSLKVRSTGGGTMIQGEAFNAASDVFTQATTDIGGGQNVAGFDTGDWLAYYNVNFPTSGAYKIEYRVASLDNGGRLSADLNAGATPLGTINVPNTGGWQNWTTVAHTVNVNAGTYNFGVFAATGRWNLNWFRITKAGSARPAAAATSSKGLEVYPNPVIDQLHLSPALVQAGRQYRILNALGKSVAAGAVERNTLNVASLPTGVYTLVVVTQDQQKIIRRFVK